MPLTPELVLAYLTQRTGEPSAPLAWEEAKCGGYRSHLNGVQMELCEIPSRAGAHWCLTLTSELNKVFVQEPHSVGLFGRKYKSASEQEIADRMRELAEMAAEQCEQRRQRAWEQKEQIRENVFRKLLFGSDAKTT